MNRFEISEEYPINLVRAVSGEDDMPELADVPDLLASVEYVLCGLTERERDILHYRYIYGMTYQEIGDVYHRSLERMRQSHNKAIRKLRHPDRKKFLLHGVKWVIANEAAKAATVEDKETTLFDKLKDVGIEALDLSVRPYNCLKIANCHTIGDVVRMYQADQLTNIRNMGRRSLDELHEKMMSAGFTDADLAVDQSAIIKYHEEKATKESQRDLIYDVFKRTRGEITIIQKALQAVNEGDEITGVIFTVRKSGDPDKISIQDTKTGSKIVGEAGNKTDSPQVDIDEVLNRDIGEIGISEDLREFLDDRKCRRVLDVILFMQNLPTIPPWYEKEIKSKLTELGITEDELRVLYREV